MKTLTMGSLFDGIGGFPLAAIHNGIVPVWASEIEAFPIEVTRLRFPDMVHVGDITKLDGAELPPVDIICGGSPCQDLSVAGNRAGLECLVAPGHSLTHILNNICNFSHLKQLLWFDWMAVLYPRDVFEIFALCLCFVNFQEIFITR